MSENQHLRNEQPESVNLGQSENGDHSHILNTVNGDAPLEMLPMLQDGTTEHWWSTDTQRLFLSLWSRNPRGNKLEILPYRSTLKLCKNDVQQHAGFHVKVFKDRAHLSTFKFFILEKYSCIVVLIVFFVIVQSSGLTYV